MNTDNLIPISFVKKFTPLAVGDELNLLNGTNPQEVVTVIKVWADGGITTNKGVLADNSRWDWALKSFAPRTNTGKRPVDDEVRVDVVYAQGSRFEDIDAGSLKWLTEDTESYCATESWKPNHEAWLKQYQSEQGANTMNDQRQKAHDIALMIEALDDNQDEQTTPNEINAATALYAFAGWLTSMKDPITFSEKHWASPAAVMVDEFIQLNKLNDDIDFDSVKTPNDSVFK